MILSVSWCWSWHWQQSKGVHPQSPLVLKGIFPNHEDFDLLPPKRLKWWPVGNCLQVPTNFSKWVCLLASFVEGVVVDFALLRVIGPIYVLCVDWVMTILPSPLLTCVAWVSLDVTVLGVINFLVKKMRDKDVPLGVLEICMHKFCEVLQYKQNNRKICKTKIC